jgi:hypothetical protein
MRFQDLQVGVNRVNQTITVNDISHEFVIYTLALPVKPQVQATFSKEGVAQKVVKIFKKEIQVGDKAFDDMVYVSTDTPDATLAFLKDQDTQSSIFAWVATGGDLIIRDNVVISRVPGAD